MADLSRTQLRQSVQDRPTEHRASILPERRDTRAPEFQGQASLRSAQRGDGGADELLRIVQGIKRAGTSVVDAATDQNDLKEYERGKADRAQANADSLAGTIDDAKMKDSVAYRKWRTKSILDVQLATTKSAIHDDITAMMNSDEDGVWGTEDVDAIIGAHFKTLITNEDGTPNEYLSSPEARELINGQYGEIRAQFITEAHDAMVKQQRAKDLDHAVEASLSSVSRGGTYDIDTFMKGLPPQIDKVEARRAFIVGMVSHARATENLEGVDHAIEAAQKEGGPQLSFQEMAQLRETRASVEEHREQRVVEERRVRYEKGTEEINELFSDGKTPDASIIWKMEREDRIPASAARMFQGAIDSAHREERAEARAAVAEARARRMEARQAYADRVEVDMAHRMLEWNLGKGPRTQEEFFGLISSLEKSGKLGEGRQLAGNIMSLDSAWKQGRAAVAANPEYGRFAKVLDDDLSGRSGGGGLTAAALGRKRSQAEVIGAISLYRELVMDKRMTPAAAYREVSQRYKSGGGVTQSKVQALDAAIADMAKRRGK
jgi:hypothetical protein